MLLNPSESTPAPARDAAGLAARHLALNLAALSTSQPELTPPALPNLTWLFARDGSLTALVDGERWWAGCSVPRAAARFMLKTMDVRGTVGCFLYPSHAAQLRVALDRLHARQAIVAIVPEPQTFAVLLHAEDFSRDIAAGRLWFATGDSWEEELEAIFDWNVINDEVGIPSGPSGSPYVAEQEACGRESGSWVAAAAIVPDKAGFDAGEPGWQINEGGLQ